jgi:thiol-disulfide isomerase/thioredoxin
LFAACVMLSAAAAQEGKTGASGSTAAPDFELPDLNGSNVVLSVYKGQKPVLIYFWATWCPHCMEVRPAVINLRKEIAPGDLEVLAINVGGGDSLARVKLFEEAHPAPYTVLYDSEAKTARIFKVQGIPHFVLIDKNGAVKYSGNQLPSNPMALLK